MGVSKHGIGGRVVLKAGGWDLDSDVLLQYGTFDTADIRAWGFGIAAGRSFNMPWRPRLGLRLDGASGGGRFEIRIASEHSTLCFREGATSTRAH